jgi:hypothetical protein
MPGVPHLYRPLAARAFSLRATTARNLNSVPCGQLMCDMRRFCKIILMVAKFPAT